MSPPRPLDAIVVGAGFAGLYMLHKLRQLGLNALVLEAEPEVGGVWYRNRYPGARCDMESLVYSYSFSSELEQEWHWQQRFAGQPEILSYLRHVADRFALRDHIRFETRVVSARFDGQWTATTDNGERHCARFLIMATGCLSTTHTPALQGLETFAGACFHTSQWPHEPADFAGRRVGVIGTGSSAIQCIPLIAQQAAHLTVFQRTPNFSLPANNAALDDAFVQQFKTNYPRYREMVRKGELFGDGDLCVPVEALDPPPVNVGEARPEAVERAYEDRWRRGGGFFIGAFADIMNTDEANHTAAEFVRGKIRSIVQDPRVAEVLSPTDHPLGAKRLCLDTDYYATFNRENVTLVDLRSDPIQAVTPTGVRLASGEVALDALVLATGFDAVTGALLAIDFESTTGEPLREQWRDGPQTYLGLGIAGYPNLFTITGPGSPSVLSNTVNSIEQHVEWIADCLDYMRQRQLTRIEPTRAAADDWGRQVDAAAEPWLYKKATNSWYLGANIPGKPRVFVPYVDSGGAYRSICDRVAAQHYSGFIFES
ncbi:flavin-containing monooxygenase [Xanthomonas theicola]|uniref:Cyclohexanone monooxygenase n=1 Tax=Xanthomonas theicola TaxID=56464 RepID=A0A2S6ZFR8_9XANT|nr:NAD(P)/FAD-dependent oxidoreductase [Xanthomonas theicola]PPT91127.1 cyclohexanone monooxygenase [Xanthomonas theicola]